MIKQVCIIGAGVSGLSAGYQLLKIDKQIQITFIEKSFKVSGRATSRVKNGFIYDTGATVLSYNQVNDYKRIEEIVNLANDKIEIKNSIYTFDNNNAIQKSGTNSKVLDKQHQNFGFKNGIISLGNALHKYCSENGAKFKLQQVALKMVQQNQGWEVSYQPDQTHIKEKQEPIIEKQFFDQVLITMPTIQACNFLKNSQFKTEYLTIQNQIIEELQKIQYISQLSIVLALKNKIEKPYFGLLNIDRQHAISWLHFEDQKDGHSPPEKSLMIIQMSHDFSVLNYDNQDQESLINQIIQKLNLLDIQITGSDLEFYEIKKWRYALPKATEIKNINQENIGIFFAGDYLKNKGRVFLAAESGFETADQINKGKL